MLFLAILCSLHAIYAQLIKTLYWKKGGKEPKAEIHDFVV